jgi:hypothetical protein
MPGSRFLRRLLPLGLALGALMAAACSSQTSPITASGPVSYASGVTPPLERIAILITITNHGTDDLNVNPADFVARDADHRVYPSNPAASATDGTFVRLATGPTPAALPLPMITLRQSDVVSGFVVFDVPQGTRPVEVIWRQTDTDQVAELAASS